MWFCWILITNFVLEPKHMWMFLSNYVVCSESIFAAELWCLQRISFRCRIMLSAANQFSLLNCSVCSESAFAAELRCLQRIKFHCRIMLSIANQFFLLNCVVCSESTFTIELCCMQWISFRCQIVLSATNQFTGESASLANWFLLTNFCFRFTFLNWSSD